MTDEVLVNHLPVARAAGANDLLIIWQGDKAKIINVGNFRSPLDGALPELSEDWNAGPVFIRANGLRPRDGGVGIDLFDDGGSGIHIEGGKVTFPGVTEVNLTGKSLPGLDLTNYLKSTDPAIGSATKITMTSHNFTTGTPVRWNGTTWAKPGAKLQFPPIDDWAGVVENTANTDANSFILHQSGLMSGFTGLTPGRAHYWNGTIWSTTAPTGPEIAQGVCQGYIFATKTTEAIVVPFKRRSSGFRLLASLPDGAGRVNTVVATGLSPAGAMLCGTAKGTGAAAIFKSVDGGITWTKVMDAPTGFDTVTDLVVGAVRPNTVGVVAPIPASPNMVAAAFGLLADLTTTSSKKWVSFAPISDVKSIVFSAPTSAWGSVGTNLTTIAIGDGYVLAPLRMASGTVNLYRGTGLSFVGWAELGTISGISDSVVAGGNLYVVADGTSIYQRSVTAAASGGTLAVSGTPFTGEALTKLAVNGKTMLVASASGKIFRSADYTLSSVSFAAATIKGDQGVAATPTINGFLYARNGWYAATNDGIYKSDDDGVNWYKIYGSSGFNVTALALTADGLVLAGTSDGKILVN